MCVFLWALFKADGRFTLAEMRAINRLEEKLSGHKEGCSIVLSCCTDDLSGSKQVTN